MTNPSIKNALKILPNSAAFCLTGGLRNLDMRFGWVYDEANVCIDAPDWFAAGCKSSVYNGVLRGS